MFLRVKELWWRVYYRVVYRYLYTRMWVAIKLKRKCRMRILARRRGIGKSHAVRTLAEKYDVPIIVPSLVRATEMRVDSIRENWSLFSPLPSPINVYAFYEFEDGLYNWSGSRVVLVDGPISGDWVKEYLINRGFIPVGFWG